MESMMPNRRSISAQVVKLEPWGGVTLLRDATTIVVDVLEVSWNVDRAELEVGAVVSVLILGSLPGGKLRGSLRRAIPNNPLQRLCEAASTTGSVSGTVDWLAKQASDRTHSIAITLAEYPGMLISLPSDSVVEVGSRTTIEVDTIDIAGTIVSGRPVVV